MDLSDYLSFRKMITPVVIQVLFWLGAALCVITGLVTMVSAMAGGSTTTQPNPFGGTIQVHNAGTGFLGFISGLAILVIGPIMVRIYCELLIVIFKIHSELVGLRSGTPPASAGTGFPVVPPPQY